MVSPVAEEDNNEVSIVAGGTTTPEEGPFTDSSLVSEPDNGTWEG